MNKNMFYGWRQVCSFSYLQTMKSKAMKITLLILCLLVIFALPVISLVTWSDKEKEKTIEQEGADTNDCSEKEIDTVNNDKQIQYQRNTIPFTSNPNPMDNYNEVYHCTDKQQSEKIQHQMKSYYRFKFEEKIIDYNNKW